jgi:quinoprotein glucose dehydrogenase
VSLDDLIDFTPEIKAEAVKIASRFKLGPIYTPPIVASPTGLRGILETYAGNWQGGAVDAETGILYVASITDHLTVGLRKPDPKETEFSYVSGGGGGEGGGPRGAPRTGCGKNGPQGLPLFKPPWGRITAIDMNTGDHLWMVPNGTTPDCVRNHPALQGVTIPNTGRLERPGIMVTKTLMFAGEGGGVRNPSGPLAGGPMFRAYDKQTGAIVWEFKLPGNQTGIPMTYQVGGKQFIVVPIGAPGQAGELVALRLP